MGVEPKQVLLTKQGIALRNLKVLRISVSELHCYHPETVKHLLRFGSSSS